MTTKPPTDDKPANIPGTQAPKRRTRGPNKPKAPDAAITVTTEASMSSTAIVKLLTDYVRKMLGDDAAASMELQINMGSDGTWHPMTGPLAGPQIIRFATKGSK